MEISTTMVMIIIFGAIVTFLPRSLPLMVMSKMQIPEGVVKWLEHIPIAVMTALVVQELIVPNEEFGYFLGNIRLFAALPTIVIAFLTRNLLLTVLVGMVSMSVLRFVL